jgi:hypothetical protein
MKNHPNDKEGSLASPAHTEGMRYPSRALRVAIARRLALGLLMTVVAIVAGWTLVSPAVMTDAATQEWYTQ